MLQPSKDSDQPGNPASLISLCCPPKEGLGLCLPMNNTATSDQNPGHPYFVDFVIMRLLNCICSAQSRNRYNSRIVLRKVGILTLLRKEGILTWRKTILELLLRKVGIGTKWEYHLLYKVGIETKLEYRIYCNLFQVVVFEVLLIYAV